jgi:hypothetical protein
VRGVGLLATLLGLVWIGQGLGYIGGSFMTGQAEWVRNGLIALVVGLAGLFLGYRRRSAGGCGPPGRACRRRGWQRSR